MFNGFVENIKKSLQDIEKKPPENEHLLESYMDILLNEQIKINTGIINELLKIDNPLIKAVCLYTEWQNSDPRDFDKIKSFFANLDLALKSYYQKDMIFSRLFEISVEKRTQFKMLDELENDLSSYVAYLDNINNKLFIVQYRILRSFANAFIVLAKNGKLTKNRPIGEKAFAVSELLSQNYRQTDRYDLQRDLLELKVDLNKILFIEKEEIIRLTIAESFENEGDNLEKRENGYGLTSYANAYIAFLDLGNKSKFENIKVKLKNSCQAMRKGLKTHQIGSFSISTKYWLESLIPSIKYYEVLKSVSYLSVLYPTYKSLSNEEIGVSIKILPFVIIDDESNVSAILQWSKEPDECIKYQSYKQFEIEETTRSLVRSALFDYLVDTQMLELNDFFELIDSSPIDERQKQNLKFAVNRYFFQDFISASYVLTLQIEPLIIILAKLKANIIAINRKPNRRGATQETTLGALLGNENVKNLFLNDYYNLLQLYFTYDLGLNYRNEIAHGLINHHKLNKGYSITVLLIICRILFMIKS